MKKRSLLLVILTAVMLVFSPLAMAAMSVNVPVTASVPGDSTVVAEGTVEFGDLENGVNASTEATVTVESNRSINTQFVGQDLTGPGDAIGVTYTTDGQDFSAGNPLTFSDVGAVSKVYTVSGTTDTVNLAAQTVGEYAAVITVTISTP